MSNSLLYLAIVAVWGVVLVPMLLRRDAAAAGGRKLRLTRRRPGELGAHDADYRADDYEGADEHDGHDGHDIGHGRDIDLAESAHGDHETGLAPTRGGYTDAPRYAPARAGLDAYPDTDAGPHGPGTGSRVEATGPPGDDAPQETRAPRPVRAGRAAIIARRRRRTTGLTGLLLATVVAVSVGLGPWWTTVPPLLLLAGHLTLLRAAVRMDAERRRAAARRRRRESQPQATGRRQAEHDAGTSLDEDGADIIDITAARQEPYDQYADAHLRAVGD